jgi:hypothetical protein
MPGNVFYSSQSSRPHKNSLIQIQYAFAEHALFPSASKIMSNPLVTDKRSPTVGHPAASPSLAPPARPLPPHQPPLPTPWPAPPLAASRRSRGRRRRRSRCAGSRPGPGPARGSGAQVSSRRERSSGPNLNSQGYNRTGPRVQRAKCRPIGQVKWRDMPGLRRPIRHALWSDSDQQECSHGASKSARRWLVPVSLSEVSLSPSLPLSLSLSHSLTLTLSVSVSL